MTCSASGSCFGWRLFVSTGGCSETPRSCWAASAAAATAADPSASRSLLFVRSSSEGCSPSPCSWSGSTSTADESALSILEGLIERWLGSLGYFGLDSTFGSWHLARNFKTEILVD